MQSGISIIGDDSITGTLKYVTDYTDFSGDPSLQQGNYLALKFTADTADKVEVGLDPTEGSGMVELDSDMNIVLRVANHKKQVVVVKVYKDSQVDTHTYNLDGLVCEAAG